MEKAFFFTKNHAKTLKIIFYRGQIGDEKTKKPLKKEVKMAKNVTSQRYEGVRSKILNNGDISYYVRFTDKEGLRKEVKVGNKSEGWSEKRASLKRGELQNQSLSAIFSTKTNIRII